MSPIAHVVLSSVTTVGVAYWSKSWAASWACFLGGIFIDLDHCLDFYLAKRRNPFKYRELSNFSLREKDGKLYLIFHSYELLTACWLWTWYGNPPMVWLGFLIGGTIHVIADQVTNPLKPLAYFFVYRLKQRFLKELILKPKFYSQLQ